MDDTNLVSSSSDGILRMLEIAQEFYDLNNTKINFNKAIFICNRDPQNNLIPLSCTPAPHNFRSQSFNFTLTPLKPKESFRFLGVWFTLSLSMSYVKKQCATEYLLFANKLRNKRLTIDQLRYLHNAVLLPKVEFRLKTTVLSSQECLRIMLPFKRTFKHASRLALSIPDAFLQSDRALGLTNLFQRLITNHSTLFAKHISMDNSLTLKKVMLHRLASIQQDLFIPYSPLFVDNFRPFTKLPAYRDDYILRLLSFSLDLGIRYTIPPATPFPTDVHHTPIYILFSDNPSLYKSSVYQLRKHKIMYLSDCISNDGMALIPFQQLIKLHSGLHTSSITPKWYKYIAAITAEAPNSIRLKDEYKTAQLAFKRPISTDHQDTRSPLNVMHIPNRVHFGVPLGTTSTINLFLVVLSTILAPRYTFNTGSLTLRRPLPLLLERLVRV
jgi:hypothetical protein